MVDGAGVLLPSRPELYISLRGMIYETHLDDLDDLPVDCYFATLLTNTTLRVMYWTLCDTRKSFYCVRIYIVGKYYIKRNLHEFIFGDAFILHD